MRSVLFAMSLLAALPAFADAPGGTAPGAGDEKRVGDQIPNDPDTQAAKQVLTQYLDLVVKKKYDAAKKLVHPKTLQVIAGIKKRLGKEEHPMAPQYWAKDDFRVVKYQLENATKHRWGTIAFDVKETDYRIQEKGEDEGNQVSYLLGKKDGKWLVVDKKLNNTFADESIKYDYKGYFDASDDKKPADKPAEGDQPE